MAMCIYSMYGICTYIVHAYVAHHILNSNLHQMFENLTIAQIGTCLYSTYTCLASTLNLLATHFQNMIHKAK